VPAAEHEPDFAARAQLFAAKVRRGFEDSEMTQRQLIDATGLSRGYIQLLLNQRGSHKDEAGDYKPPNPTLDVVWRLADALELDLGYLVDPAEPVRLGR
jgi:transcriptional regulator with XRE-family HTH domain